MTIKPYPGPVRAEPLPVELHNTLYADAGGPIDGLEDDAGLRAWISAIGARIPSAAQPVDTTRLEEFRSLRATVREALAAVLSGRPVSKAVREELNRLSAANPGSLQLVRRRGTLESELHHHAPSPTDVALGVLAASTIELLGGAHASELRACGAPGCVLMFLKDHPRREWCSAACGNRARQARHYARTRGR